MPLYFEDLLTEDEVPMGEHPPLSEDEIVEFARRYDPQWIHCEPARAEKGPFGGIIASGFHTLSMMMRVACDAYIVDSASSGSPGMDEVRFHAPVRPGDRLRVTRKTLQATRSRSKPDRGSILMMWTAYNQHGSVVASIKIWGIHYLSASTMLPPK